MLSDDLAMALKKQRPDLVVEKGTEEGVLIRTPKAALRVTIAPLRKRLGLASSEADRQAAIVEFAREELQQLADLEAPRPLTAEALFPAIRTAAQVKQLAAIVPAGDTVFCMAFKEGLSTCLVRSIGDDTLETLTQPMLEGSKLTQQDLHAKALDNLRRRFPKLPPGDSVVGVWLVNSLMGASLMLLPELWKTSASRCKGELLAIPISRDLVVWGDGGLKETPDSLQAVARNLAQVAPLPLTDRIFKWTSKGFEAR